MPKIEYEVAIYLSAHWQELENAGWTTEFVEVSGIATLTRKG